METHCGTTGYASPEMLSGKKYLGVETDVWSLGIILYILLCGGLPFDHDDERVMKDMIIKGEYEEPEWLSQGEFPLGCAKSDARSLIRALLSQNPSDRPTVEAIFSHPWFNMTITDTLPGSHSMPASPLPPHFVEPWAKVDTLQLPSAMVASPLSTPLSRSSSTVAEYDFHNEEIKRVHSGEFSHTEQAMELLHSNPPSKPIIRSPLQTLDETTTLDHTLHLPVAQSSRTPSRTKRRSVSSLSLERRLSHSSISQYQTYTPEDYLTLLHSKRPARFSTPSEKFLLNQLNDLGFDIGQLTHSVESDACDSSSSAWWLLRAKQAERGETDEVITARLASNARKREKLAAYAREDRRKTREAPSVAFADDTPRPYHLAPPIISHTSSSTVTTVMMRASAPSTPTKEIQPSESPRKERSPSMLQRATSALLGEESSKPETSPTKLVKPRSDFFGPQAEAGPSKPSSVKPKRDSMWTSFRQFFDQGGQRKRRKDLEGKPTIVLSRGIAARAPHVNRVNQARRGSLDRPQLYSRRSSSVNSRRSSVTSLHLGRRASLKSHGSQTPTSDREESRRSSIRGLDLRQPISPLPLHTYQRRPPQGTASKRIRHIRVIPEAVLRSGASSIKSASSRASSPEGHREDSDHSTDASLRNRHPGQRIHRKGSPLVSQAKRVTLKPKSAVRDVFQSKDEDWEDEEPLGGYGQAQPWVQHFTEGKKKREVAIEKPMGRRGVPRGAPLSIAEEEEEEE